MTPIRTLVDRDQDKLKPGLPPGLRDLYVGDLHFQTAPAERPFVFANFVSSLDGVVSYAIKGQASGSVISGSDPADRFIMGLLRASPDAPIVGARTVQDTGPQNDLIGYPPFGHKPSFRGPRGTRQCCSPVGVALGRLRCAWNSIFNDQFGKLLTVHKLDPNARVFKVLCRRLDSFSRKRT